MFILPSKMIPIPRATKRLGLAGLMVLSGLWLGACRRVPQAQTQASPNEASWAQAQNLKADASHGRRVYEANCLQCHGMQGAGDGPAAGFLRPKPTNFRNYSWKLRDEELFAVVASGIPNSPMPGFGEQLSNQDFRDVISYIKTFASKRR